MSQNPRFEVRLDDKGEFDELVVYDENGECYVHLEMMSDKHLWGAVYYGKTERVSFNVMSKKRLDVSAYED